MGSSTPITAAETSGGQSAMDMEGNDEQTGHSSSVAENQDVANKQEDKEDKEVAPSAENESRGGAGGASGPAEVRGKLTHFCDNKPGLH